MDEFVTEMQTNIGITPEDTKNKSNRFRELFGKIIVSPSYEINIIEKCNEEGDVIFEVPMKSIGIPYDVLVDYKDEIISDWFANFIGELLIRENINKFAKIITELGDDYFKKVNGSNHVRFGNRLWKDKFIFTFHISLVQKILTEKILKKIV
jgi:hypothetical protein